MVDTVRTESELLTNLFQDGQPAGSITPQDMRDFIISVKHLMGGWNFVLDGTYTSGSPRSITAATRTKVTIDGTGENIGHPTADVFWNTITNKIVPSGANDFGIVRFAVQGQSTVATDNRFEVELDVGGTSGVIFKETGVFAKGAGNPQNFNFSIPLFAGADFITNGGEIYITPDADATFWEFGLTSVQVYTAAP